MTGQGRRIQNLRWVDLRSVLLPVASVLAVLLVLNAGFYLLLTRPRLEMAAGSKASLLELNARLQDQREAVRKARAALDRIRSISSDLQRFRNEILSSKMERMTRIQKSLRDLARTFRMDPESITYQNKEIEESSLIALAISFPLRGSYEDLRQFLHHVEESELFLTVESVRLRGTHERGSELNLNIKLNTYFAAEDAPQEVAAGRAGEAGAGGGEGS